MVPKNVIPWIVYVFGQLVRITDGLAVVCGTLLTLGMWNSIKLKCLVHYGIAPIEKRHTGKCK